MPDPSVTLATLPAQTAASCWRCCRLTSRSELTQVNDGELCPDCVDKADRCEECDRPTTNGPAITVDLREICESCRSGLQECEDCGLWDKPHHLEITPDGACLCASCIDENYWHCDDCLSLVRIDESCADCEPETLNLHQPDYQPRPIFHGEGPLYLGFELEINRGWTEGVDIAETCLGNLGYLKEDNSLDPGGFEIVTHPMSLSYARERFPWRMLDALREAGASSQRAGLHVHVSRQAFDSPAHVYRWLKLIYRNHGKVADLARRKSSLYAMFSPNDRLQAKTYAKGCQWGAKCSAVNVSHSDTFEVRVFNSSLYPHEVLAALEFVAASVEYTRDLSVPVIVNGGWTWEAFYAWVDQHPDYATLAAEMRTRCAC